MKVLFVSSGNKKETISSLILEQGESIKKAGLEISYYRIKGKGLKGYQHNIFLLRKYLKSNRFDVIHAHYSLSGYVATLAGAKPLVVSLMGSDVKESMIWRILLRLFLTFSWDACIVKSEDMKNTLRIKNLKVVPNGVDLKFFFPLSKEVALEHLGWDRSKKHILFAADPDRKEKNFTLARKSFSLIDDRNTELHFLKNVSRSEIPYHYYASDVILLTSLWEGSPNVIKEAMACNCPIVSTNVGDVEWLLRDSPGHFITGFDPEDVANCIKLSLDKNKSPIKTNGRERIAKIGLDSETITNKIVELYKDLLKTKD